VPNLQEILTALASSLALAALCGLFILYARAVRDRRPPLPPQRHRAVPWTGLEVCLVALIYFIAQALVDVVLLKSKVLDLLYGVDFQAGLGALRDKEAHEYASNRLGLWATALALPFKIGAILSLLHFVSGTRPYQLGLTTEHARINVYLGARYWLLSIPWVMGINILASVLFSFLTGRSPDEHPIARLIQGEALPVDWFLVIFIAMFAAPLLEELIFRGILQPFFARRSWGGDAAMAAALGFALLPLGDKFLEAIANGDYAQVAVELAPALFVVALLPGYFASERLAQRCRLLVARWEAGDKKHTQRNIARAWYGTAALFAAVHSNVWPSPIPLFVLALVLGWLAYRTQSLVGPIVLHTLFNGVACALLIVSQLGPAPPKEKGKEATSAVRRPAAVSTSTTVPGSWLPRRR
jgi:membrane protease YdiL (CAAX protease family)